MMEFLGYMLLYLLTALLIVSVLVLIVAGAIMVERDKAMCRANVSPKTDDELSAREMDRITRRLLRNQKKTAAGGVWRKSNV